MWQKQNKSIICIGSTAKDHNEPAEITKPYYHQKIALETIIDNFGVYGKGKCKVLQSKTLVGFTQGCLINSPNIKKQFMGVKKKKKKKIPR